MFVNLQFFSRSYYYDVANKDNNKIEKHDREILNYTSTIFKEHFTLRLATSLDEACRIPIYFYNCSFQIPLFRTSKKLYLERKKKKKQQQKMKETICLHFLLLKLQQIRVCL